MGEKLVLVLTALNIGTLYSCRVFLAAGYHYLMA